MPALSPGTIIGGKFRIERLLGQGGMGTVVVATHVQLGQRVALKFLNDELAREPAVVERFLREARAAARLQSDHVCHVSDVGQHDDGSPYIVMELLEGEDLAAAVSRQALDPATAADYVLQACVAIAEAHAQGIVHRDLKPGNLFLTRRLARAPIIKVLDFGIATAPATGGNEFRATRTTMVMGSPGYMSPEQLRSAKAVDARSDIWSLGVILYELTTKRLPFPGEALTEMTVKITADPPEPFHVSPELDRVILRCLEKSPERRYGNVAELARDLAACAPVESGYLANVIAELLGAAPTIPPRAPTGVGAAPTVPPARSMLPFVLIAGAVLLSAAIVTVVIVTRDHGGPTPAKPDAARAIDAAPPPPVDSSPIDTPPPPPPIDAAIDAPPDAPIDAGPDEKQLVQACEKFASDKKWKEVETCIFTLVDEADRKRFQKLVDEHKHTTPPPPPPGDKCSDAAVEKHRQAGEAFLTSAQYEAAFREFSAIMICRPKDVKAHLKEGYAACKSHRANLAHAVYVELGSDDLRAAMVSMCHPEGIDPSK